MHFSTQNGSGIAAAWHVEDAASTVYYLLHSLQHRGSDGAGIASADGNEIKTLKRSGMLSEIFTADKLEELQGDLAVGQVRMASESDQWMENLQPIRVRSHLGPFAIVCSGMISNAPSLREHMEEEGLIFQGTSDAEIIAHLVQVASGTLKEKIEKACQMLKGAYTLILMTKNTMYAVRSRDGIRSLYLAKHNDGYLIASETAAFGLFKTDEIREVEAGEMVVLSKEGYGSRQVDLPLPSPCAMEAVYYSREDSLFEGCSVHKMRQMAGRLLAKKESVDADIVIGVPDTALSAAAAFARELNKPYEIGLIKNRYIGSTFVRPTQQQREQGMRVRLNAISSIVKDKNIYLIDDSIQKGDTAARLCQLLREAGAKSVHLRIASPIISHSCFYGTEYIEAGKLAGNQYSVEEMKELFQADSLRFLDYEDFQSMLPKKSCSACMDGCYPSDLFDYSAMIQEGK